MKIIHYCSKLFTGVLRYHAWYVDYKEKAGQPAQSGPACCAADSVFFHYVGAEEQRWTGGPWPRPALFDRWEPIPLSAAEETLLSKLG